MKAKVVHLADPDTLRSLCGIQCRYRPIHKDWPTCHNCERIRKARQLPSPTIVWDSEGWLIHPITTTASSSSVIAYVTGTMNYSITISEWRKTA